MRLTQSSVVDQYLDRIEQYRTWVRTIDDEHTPVGVGVVKTPGVVGGSARIYDTRIPVWQLVQVIKSGVTEAELDDMFEYLPSDAYTNALDYYALNAREIEREIAEDQALDNQS